MRKDQRAVIFHDYYAEVPPAEVERFVAGQEMGRLVTVGEDGVPHIHLVRKDEQAIDLRARPRCVFEVDEVLGTIPSYRVDPDQTVIFDCEAIVSEDVAALAEQQVRSIIWRRYG